jgi:uncharacterized protein YggE
MKSYFLAAAILAAACALFAQDIQVNRQNKTIAVTADDSVTADAEIAVLEIGYHNYAPTQDAAFYENVRVADQITKALLDAKIPKTNIETEKLRLSRTDIDEKWTPEMKKERQFTAEQSWHVTVSASQAQLVVDLAMKAGANELDDVEWNVADPVALQARAGSAALAKARAVADQMAKGLGTKLGELIYASNRAPIAKMFRGMTLNTESAVMAPPPPPPPPQLTLFPQKVKSDATVYAVFSIE